MIVFRDILKLLADHGWSQNRLIREKVFGMSTIQRLRKHANINTSTIDTVCELCDCQPGDIMHYEPNNKGD